MYTRIKIISIAISLGSILWVIDSLLDYFLFYHGKFLDLLIFNVPSHEIYIRIFILIIFAIFGAYVSGIIRKLDETNALNKELIRELQDAISNVKKLSGLIPICASCKKIRDDKGYWNQIESYIRDHSEAEFSHGICPECVKILYPNINLDIDSKK